MIRFTMRKSETGQYIHDHTRTSLYVNRLCGRPSSTASFTNGNLRELIHVVLYVALVQKVSQKALRMRRY